MRKTVKIILIAALWIMVVPPPARCQETGIAVNTDWDHERYSWQAHWITHPAASTLDYGVFLFRNEFFLEEIPDSFKVHVSADNRYKLHVNGEMICTGPAKGSFNHWRYETIDLRPWLIPGTNVIAAEVFNLGEFRPAAMFSRQTAFILQGDGNFASGLNTPGTWKVTGNRAYRPIPVTKSMVGGYYVAGPTDSFRSGLHPWGWKESGYDDLKWREPRSLGKGVGRGYMHGVPWMLVPRNIPLLESKPTRFERISRSSWPDISPAFIRGTGAITIPAESHLTILLDQGHLMVGYPLLRYSRGEGSRIKITYAEALRDSLGNKGNRNQIEGKEILGYHDLIVADSGENRQFSPLWLRTWRYVQLEIRTGKEPLTLDEFSGISNTYPFTATGSFRSDHPRHREIWDVGWRTARLCAGETYMDCPYYEQLQYLGDTRIQALISLYVSGDDRLMRNALETADQSRLPGGLTLSRGPSFIPQIIPAFSLYWVDMVHDYYMHRQDDDFLEQFLPGIDAVLGWFERRVDHTGMLGKLEWLNFADWTDGFMVGAPPGVDTGHSALVTLNYVYALQRAAALFEHFGEIRKAALFKEQAARSSHAVYQLCFDRQRGVLAGIPLAEDPPEEARDQKLYSQHTNIWGILTDAIPPAQQDDVMHRILEDTSLVQATIYFRFYLFRALKKCGMGERYTSMLDPWEEMLDKGLTTFEEGDYEERSDCHAWSSSPLYDLLAIVCGITPAEPGFRSVMIAPAPGDLKHIEATVPHPSGLIQLELERHRKSGIKGSVQLPEGIPGTFRWNDQEIKLTAGMQLIKVK